MDSSAPTSPLPHHHHDKRRTSQAKARRPSGAQMPRISPLVVSSPRVPPPPQLRSTSAHNAASRNISTIGFRPADDGLLHDEQLDNTATEPDQQQQQQQHKSSDLFSSTIQELENLLNEALHIARMAAEEQETDEFVPEIGLGGNTSQEDKGIPLIPLTRTKAKKPGPLLPQGGKKIGGPEGLGVSESLHVPATLAEKGDSPGTAELARRDADSDLLSVQGVAYNDANRRKSSAVMPSSQTAGQNSHKFGSAPVKRLAFQLRDGQSSQPQDAAFFPKKPQEHLSRRRQTVNRSVISKKDVRDYIKLNDEPPIGPRSTSSRRSSQNSATPKNQKHVFPVDNESAMENTEAYSRIGGDGDLAEQFDPKPGHEGHFRTVFGVSSKEGSEEDFDGGPPDQKIDLNGCRHVDIPHRENFDVHKSRHHQPVARDWPNSRKRFAACIASVNTAMLGIIIGIYSGEVPAIQYVIIDFHHYAILGNVFLYIGLAIPALFLWPLPLLHGRKPYTVVGLSVALCLQIPQGIAVSGFDSPYVVTYRRVLLLSRAISGFAFGFASINQLGTLLDLFGASLQSGNPHQEMVDEFDVRRHGGGMGAWLGIWSWCTMGSISIGFLIGAVIIGDANASWGFWTSLLLLMFVLFLNIISPEVRRSAFRRTVAAIKGEEGDFSRVGRGEIKMHVKEAGPYWWGEEIKAGMQLSYLMIQQPGFAVMALYTAWVYAQFTMMLMLLGALASRYYQLYPAEVGACGLSLGVGALLGLPFAKASLFSRARHHPPRTDSMSFEKHVICSSHLARRVTFTVMLPVAAIAYTLTARGPPMPISVPVVLAGLVGFLSNLATGECYGLVMETFDTSDLQPEMTGRPRASIWGKKQEQRTNFSCYPRVSAGFGIIEGLKFILAATATGVCGRLERRLGVIKATGIMAGVLMSLTALLTVMVFRFRSVRMIPDGEHLTRRRGTEWRPVILGSPSGSNRKISILEAGGQTRWSEIRRKNRVYPGMAW